MDPAVAALDFAKAGAIIANMIESYLAAGATPLNAEGAEHAEREDCRSSFGTASLHLHSPVDDGTSASQSGEHRASVQSREPSEVARLDSGADPDSRRGSRTIRPTDDQARRLQDPCERRRDGASRRDLLSGVIASGALQQGLASIAGTMRHYQDLGVRWRRLLRPGRFQRQPRPRHEGDVRSGRTAFARASTEVNSIRHRRGSCVFLYRLVWYSMATRSFSTPTRRCKALYGRSSTCLSRRAPLTVWFDASISADICFRAGHTAVSGMASLSGAG